MRALLVQPPLVQLNAPYPAVHYLQAFLASESHEARTEDHSIALVRALWSRRGLGLAFADAEATLAARPAPDPDTARELERYLSSAPLYLDWIEALVAFLSGGDPSFAHRLAAAAEFPRGARAEAFLGECGGRPGPEEAAALATRILDDLGDFVSYALDPAFGTVRYGERLARSRGDWAEVEEGLRRGWLVERLYRPLLRERFAAAKAEGRVPGILLVTVPFPGCLVGALACAEEARRAFGPGTAIALGGGYVTTELRGMVEPRIFAICDYLSFDAGYGSLASILARLGGDPGGGLYRTMYRDASGRVVAAGFPEGDLAREAAGTAPPGSSFVPRAAEDCPGAPRFAALERRALASVQPDYRDAPFGDYLRVVDSRNAMHRLWSESPWLKYRLAEGCYWRKCAFCDTGLDYVANWVPAELPPLLAAADGASARTGLTGIHFTDEALPMARLLAFAEANRVRAAEGKRPFTYWGNVRFDASWTGGRCELLAASGLVAVSGGVEIATERGLAMTDKGFDLAGLARTLVAMRRAGLLVHAYLIYGFPGQGAADIVDSAEVTRQLFAAGLVDSAFWHRFVLTRHSRMRSRWLAGELPGLVPVDRGGAFAANDLEFEGESAYDDWGPALDALLAAWSSGEELDRPAALSLAEAGAPLPRGGTRPRAGAAGAGSIPEDLVERLVAVAEEALDAEAAAAPGKSGAVRLHWLAGRPLSRPAGPGRTRLAWTRRGEAEELELPEVEAERLLGAIRDLASRPAGLAPEDFFARAGLEAGGPELARLLGSGLLAV